MKSNKQQAKAAPSGSSPRRGNPYATGPELDALLAGLSEQKNGMAAEGTMKAIGQYCADHLLDGVITRAQLKTLRGFPDRRKLARHVSWLVACGALTATGEAPANGGLAEAYELTNYLAHNFCRANRLASLERLRTSKERSSATCRSSESGNGDYHGIIPASPPKFLEEPPVLVEEFNFDDTVRTESKDVTTCSLTSASACEQPLPETKSRKMQAAEESPASGAPPAQSKPEEEEKSAEDIAEEFMRGIELAQGRELPRSEAPSADDSPNSVTTLYKKHLESQGKEIQEPSSPVEAPKKAHKLGGAELPNYLPARIPSDPALVNEHDVVVFLMEALGEQPTEGQQRMLLRTMRTIRARRAELKYVSWWLKHFTRKGGAVTSHIAWARSVILRQRRHQERENAELSALGQAA